MNATKVNDQLVVDEHVDVIITAKFEIFAALVKEELVRLGAEVVVVLCIRGQEQA